MTSYIAACRDIDPARLQTLMPDAELPPVYPGSTAGTCFACSVPVWVGPRMQEAIELHRTVVVACFPCAAQLNADEVRSLGNPFVRRPAPGPPA